MKRGNTTARLSAAEQYHAAGIIARFTMLVNAWMTNDFREVVHFGDELERLGFKVELPG